MQITDTEQTYYALKGVIGELPADEQAAIDKCITAMKKAMAEAGETNGLLAIGLLGAGVARQQEKEGK